VSVILTYLRKEGRSQQWLIKKVKEKGIDIPADKMHRLCKNADLPKLYYEVKAILDVINEKKNYE